MDHGNVLHIDAYTGRSGAMQTCQATFLGFRIRLAMTLVNPKSHPAPTCDWCKEGKCRSCGEHRQRDVINPVGNKGLHLRGLPFPPKLRLRLVHALCCVITFFAIFWPVFFQNLMSGVFLNLCIWIFDFDLYWLAGITNPFEKN